MRRHITMDQLATDILRQASEASSATEKTSAYSLKAVSDIAENLVKLANEIRKSKEDSLTYHDIAHAAEGRLGKR